MNVGHTFTSRPIGLLKYWITSGVALAPYVFLTNIYYDNSEAWIHGLSISPDSIFVIPEDVDSTVELNGVFRLRYTLTKAPDTEYDMKRRGYLQGIGTLGLGLALAGCSGFTEPGTIRTRVQGSPQTIESFRRLEITVDGIRVKPLEGEEQDHDLDEPVELDLVQPLDEAPNTIAEIDIEPGTYAYLQLEAVAEEATMQNGESADFGIPGDADRLKIRKEFDIQPGQTTIFIAEIEAVHPGSTDTFVLQANASEAEVITDS